MQRLSQLLTAIYGRNLFYTRKLDAAGVRVDALRFPDDLRAAAADDEGGAGGGPGRESRPGVPR